ncbi:MAG: threonine/serine exporter family protein [Faecalibacterium sp.]
MPGGFRKISCAALSSRWCCILACRVLGTLASHSIIGSLMILTPGIAFTMGIRDFVHGDYLSGTIRMIDALLIAASIAIGTGLVLSLYALFDGGGRGMIELLHQYSKLGSLAAAVLCCRRRHPEFCRSVWLSRAKACPSAGWWVPWAGSPTSWP